MNNISKLQVIYDKLNQLITIQAKVYEEHFMSPNLNMTDENYSAVRVYFYLSEKYRNRNGNEVTQ